MKAIQLFTICLIVALGPLKAQDLSQCKRTCKRTRILQTGPLIGLRTLTLPDSQFVRVVEVVKRGASEKYGILLGDTLTHFNGKVIQNMNYFIAEVAKLQPGDTVTVTARRNQVPVLFRFPLGAAQTRRITELVCCDDLPDEPETAFNEEFTLEPVEDTKPVREKIRKENNEQNLVNETAIDPLDDPLGQAFTDAAEKREAKREAAVNRQLQLEKERDEERIKKEAAERLAQVEKEREEERIRKEAAEQRAQVEKEREEERIKKEAAERLAQLEKQREEERIRKANAEEQARQAQVAKEREAQRMQAQQRASEPTVRTQPDPALNNIVFELSPNPAVNYLRVSANEAINYKVRMDIQDPNGNVLQSETITNPTGRFETTLDIEELPNGLYFLKIYVDNTNYIQRFRKQK
jgi:hypothetical protein